jgi:AcrR family transcriptional regulator
MESPVRPRSTRDRPAKPPLSEDLILDTALRILREEGLEAVTMRRLATELDTGPASLYVYISGRQQLREAMLDRVARMVEVQEPDPARWREQVHRLVKQTLTAMEAHPGIAEVAVANPPSGEYGLQVADNLLGLLRAGGITAQDAAWACDIIMLIATASAVETAVYQQRDLDESRFHDRLHAVFASLPAARYPHLAALSAEMINGDGDQRFHFAIDTFLDGLVARAARARAGER